MSRILFALVVAAGMVVGLAAAAYAPYHSPTAPQQTGPAFKAQARTAATHAAFAADSASVSSVREHLGHALACIEGRRGQERQPRLGEPVSGDGSGRAGGRPG